MSLALSIYALCISIMSSVNGAQFLNRTYLYLLFGAAAVQYNSIWDGYNFLNTYLDITGII